jgi:hypothetical protein
MKKRLEADLVSIAHRILQLKNKSDVNVLFLETQKLYEKLAILKFVEENLGDVKPTIGQAGLEDIIEKAFDEPAITSVTPLAEPITITAEKETVSAPQLEVTVDAIIESIPSDNSILEAITHELTENKTEEDTIPTSFVPIFEPAIEAPPTSENIATEKVQSKKEVVQISFEDLLGSNYSEPQFVKAETVQTSNINPIAPSIEMAFDKVETLTEENEVKPKSLNDKLSKVIAIDLNDRIGFVKHLFGNSNEDYNRVLSQLNSFNNFFEAKSFIDEMIKPEYNNWDGKDDYAHRFMEIVEKKFL